MSRIPNSGGPLNYADESGRNLRAIDMRGSLPFVLRIDEFQIVVEPADVRDEAWREEIRHRFLDARQIVLDLTNLPHWGEAERRAVLRFLIDVSRGDYEISYRSTRSDRSFSTLFDLAVGMLVSSDDLDLCGRTLVPQFPIALP